MTAPLNLRATEAHWDEAIAHLREAANVLEKGKRLAFPPQVPAGVDGFAIGSRVEGEDEVE